MERGRAAAMAVADTDSAWMGCFTSRVGAPGKVAPRSRPRLAEEGAVGLARSGARRLDDAAGRIDGLGYIHFGRVEQDGVRGAGQRRGLAPRVAGVAALDVIEHVLEGDGLTLADELLPAALRADLGCGGDEDLHGGLRRDDGADV